MSEENREETLDESAQRTSMWDDVDSRILHSVHAYLMYHSGALYRNSEPDREARTISIDMQADGAEAHAVRMGFDMSDRRRVEAMLSLDTQSQHAPGDTPICYLDVEMIEEAFHLPAYAPAGITLEPLEVGWPRFSDYEDLKRNYRELSYYLKHYPSEVDYQFQRLQRTYLQVANYEFIQEVDSFHFIPPEYHIIGVSNDRNRNFVQLNSEYDVGQLVVLRGQVIEISEPKHTYTSIAWKCKDSNCREVHFVEQDPVLGVVAKPEPSCGKYAEMEHGESNNCSSRHFIRLPPPMSNAQIVQRMTLQEESLTNGEARTVTLEVRGALTESVIAGQGIEVVGILATEPISKGSLLENKFILVKSITERTDVVSNVTVTESEREAIQAFVDTVSYADRMKQVTDSWAGRVYAEDHIKEAIILQSCGGSYNAYSETRGTIHMLVVGDPGTAKTKLLQLATKLHPGSRFVQADVTTQAGLVGACSQVEDMYTGKKKWALLPGALALTHPDAICAVDEFNLYKGDFGDFNNAMESGEVFINKVVKGRIVTAAPVLAGANPNNGNKKKWIRGEQVPYTQQIGLDFTMLQRFAIIFVLEDTPDYERDRNISLSMTKGISTRITEEEDEGLDLAFIQKYLAVARSIDPLFTKKAEDYVADMHAQKRKENTDSDDLRSHRLVNSLWRVACAIARFELSETVTIDHIHLAEKIMAESLQEKDPGLFTTDQSKADRELRKAVEEGIINYFVDNDSDEGIDALGLHESVSKSISGWRKPTLNEFEQILASLSEKEGNGFMRAGDRYYPWGNE